MSAPKASAKTTIGKLAAAEPAAGKGPAPAAQPVVSASNSSVEAFTAIVERIEETVEAETETLRRNLPAQITELSFRKRQGMLELGRAMKLLQGQDAREQVRERLASLARKLEQNRYLLDVNLRAVREVADIIARSMKEAESDGTYSLRLGRS